VTQPYYQDDAVTLYHGDCREILPSLVANLIVTDPPFNVGKDYGTYKDRMEDSEYEVMMRMVAAAAERHGWVAPFVQLRLFLDILGPQAVTVVVRRGARGPYRFGWSNQHELLLALGKPNRCVPDLWDDIRLKGEGYFFREEDYGNPGYTPYQILARLVALLSEPGELIVDPFMGTGTTVHAAKAQGRRAVGIELNERDCEIAASRCSQEVLALDTGHRKAVATS
jgi:site-specific DNA-methyltransferase (adenine-specific)